MGTHASHEIEIIARGLMLSGPWVLLTRGTKQTTQPPYLYLPGGHVEWEESARAACEREFLEESGVRVKAGELAWISESRFQSKKRAHHELVLVFHVEPPKRFARGTVSTPPPPFPSLEPKITFEWVRLPDLAKRDVRPRSHRDHLAKLARSRRGRGGEPLFLSDFQ